MTADLCTWPTCLCTAAGQFCRAPVAVYPTRAVAIHMARLAEALAWIKRHGIHGENCDTVTKQEDPIYDLDFDIGTLCTCGLTAIAAAKEGK